MKPAGPHAGLPDPERLPAPAAATIALAGAAMLAIVMGIGRFAYTPLLPALSDALNWSLAAAGDVATANFVGYLAGALIAGPLAARRERAVWLAAALVASVLTTLAGAWTSDYIAWLVLRAVGGVASAFGVVIGSALVLDALARSATPRRAAWYFSGVGIGIVLSVLVIEAARAAGADVFAQWGALGLVAAPFTVFALRVFHRLPNRPPAAASGTLRAVAAPARAVRRIVAAYGLLGFGYVITATFLVAMARDSHGARWLEPVSWIVVGATAAPSVPFVQALAARHGMLRVMRAAFLIEAGGVLLAGYGSGPTAVLIGAACLGATFLSITALVLGAARTLGGARTEPLLGWMTAAFGFGQLVGPALAGRLATIASGFGPPSLLAACALIGAAVLLPRRMKI